MFISHKTGGEWDLNIQKALTSYPGPVNRTGSSHLGQTLIGLDLERLRVYFWQCLHRSLVTRVSPNLRQYVSSHVAHFGKKTTTHGPLVSVLTYSLLKDCIKNCHSFCYVFVLKWKKDKKWNGSGILILDRS